MRVFLLPRFSPVPTQPLLPHMVAFTMKHRSRPRRYRPSADRPVHMQDLSLHRRRSFSRSVRDHCFLSKYTSFDINLAGREQAPETGPTSAGIPVELVVATAALDGGSGKVPPEVSVAMQGTSARTVIPRASETGPSLPSLVPTTEVEVADEGTLNHSIN